MPEWYSLARLMVDPRWQTTPEPVRVARYSIVRKRIYRLARRALAKRRYKPIWVSPHQLRLAMKQRAWIDRTYPPGHAAHAIAYRLHTLLRVRT